MEIQVNMLKKGERFKLHPGDERIYVRQDYVFKENKYTCSLLNAPRERVLLDGNRRVFRVLAYIRKDNVQNENPEADA